LAVLTGATGFIGQHLAERLQREGWRLRIFSRRPEAAAEVACESAVVGQFSQPEKLCELVRGADLVIHCAGAIKARGRADFHDANAENVERLIQACAATDSRPRFILLSTLAAREPGISAYAGSKQAGEELAGALRDALASLTVLRPPAVYGPGDRETLTFFQLLQRGFAVAPKQPGARLSLIHVEDLVECIARLAASESPPEGVFEVGDPVAEGYSWPELIAAGEAAVGRRARHIALPRPVASALGATIAAASGLAGVAPMLSRDKAAELFHPDWVVHDRRLQAALGCWPQTGIERGFAETVAWYRARSWLR
jgi:nucleoside-diphosphate-sugar epimerase